MENRPGYKDNKPACIELYEPFPEFVTCPKCGEDVEIWTDEEETHCIFCGYHLFRKETIVH
ncbi:MAG: hypothetical protein N2257_04220 [Thermodesulfovibrionales bacterium]|nr:hypothetical protein [Thermodesulfovibrionales bacterium]